MASLLPTTGQRRLPRVRYRVPVRISGDFSDRDPVFVLLVGQSLDMGEGGMALETPLELRLGSTVACSLRLGGRQAYFLGRVAWRHGSPSWPIKRVGIQFVAPSEADASLLRHVVALGERYRQQVLLRFEGRADTVSALARTDDRGLVLSAPLPILQQRTKVRFSFAEDGPGFAGAVAGTQIAKEQGLLTLQVKIDVAAESARAYGQHVRALARAQDAEAETPIGIELADRAPPVRVAVRARGAASWAPGHAIAALSVAALIALALWPAAWPGLGIEAAQLTGSLPALPASLVASPARSTDDAARSAQQALEPDAQRAVLTAHAADGAFGGLLEPTFKWRRSKREIRIPLHGDRAGLRHYRITSPPGIAIELPFAQSRVSRPRYSVGHAGVLRLDVAERAAGTSIRLWLREAPPEYEVFEQQDAVVIRLPGKG